MWLTEKLTMREYCIDEHGYTDAPIIQKLNEVIDRLNTRDAVSVVRCRECEYGKPCGLDVACYHPECDLCGGVASHEPEFFCAYGERKDGAE